MRSVVGVAVICLCLSACGGESRARVSGSVLENGNPLVLNEGDEISMSFVAVHPDAPMGLGSVEFDRATSRFAVRAPDREDIPPGEYKIVVTVRPLEDGETERPERFDGAFAEGKTPLRYTVSAQKEQEIVVDLTAQTVTAK